MNKSREANVTEGETHSLRTELSLSQASLRRSPGIAIVVLLLLASPFLSKVAVAQPSQGNWVITGTQVVQNESIALTGNLTIENGGNLTLQNVKLKLDVGYDGEYGVFVGLGGSLYIYNSTITSGDQTHRFDFIVQGDNFMMKDSTVQYAGSCTYQNIIAGTSNCSQGSTYDGSQGLTVYTDGADIEGNNISDGGIGLILAGSNEVVKSNNFNSSQYSSIVITYHQNGAQGPSFSNDTVEGNTIHQDVLLDSSLLIIYGDGGNLIQNNTFTSTQTLGSVTLFAITDDGGWANTIRDNHISATAGMWISGETANDLIQNNAVTYCEAGIELVNVPANLVEGNTFLAGLATQSNGHPCGGSGVYVRGGRNIMVVNNTVSAENVPPLKNGAYTFIPESAIQLVQSIDGHVLNNNLTSWGFSPSLWTIDSSGNTVAGNLLSSARKDQLSYLGAGIFMYASDNNTVFDNQSNSTDPYSISLYGSNANSIYHNNFLGTGEMAYDDGLNNSWSVGNTGNYWSSYSGGGTYPVLPNGRDGHPSISPVVVTTAIVPSFTPVPLPNSKPTPTVMVVSNATKIIATTATYEAGTIDVKPGGNLTIENSDLTIGTIGFNINIEEGGSMTIANSKIVWGTGGIEVNPGGSLTIANSSVLVTGQSFPAMGFSLYGTLNIEKSQILAVPNAGGFDIATVDANNVTLSITHSVLDGGTDTGDLNNCIKLEGDYQTLVMNDSTLENCPGGIALVHGGHSTAILSGDTFARVPDPVSTANPIERLVFANNTIDTELGIGLNAGYLILSQSTVNGSWGGGLAPVCGGNSHGACSVVGNTVRNVVGIAILLSANGALVANNTITNAQGGIDVFGDNNTVYGNTVLNSSSGISVQGANNDVYDNTFVPTTTTSTTVSTTTQSTTTSISTTSIVSNSTSSSSSPTSTRGGGGIPDFPFQTFAVGVFTSVIVVSYLLLRRKTQPSGPSQV